MRWYSIRCQLATYDRNIISETRNKLCQSHIDICPWKHSHNVDYISTSGHKCISLPPHFLCILCLSLRSSNGKMRIIFTQVRYTVSVRIMNVNKAKMFLKLDEIFARGPYSIYLILISECSTPPTPMPAIGHGPAPNSSHFLCLRSGSYQNQC
jgi:hypothetical protein